MIIVCVHDRKADIYENPHFFTNVDTAVRAFQMALKNKETTLSQFVQDFDFVCIGRLDLEKGQVEPCEHFVVCHGSDYLKPEQYELDLEGSDGKKLQATNKQ